METLGQEREGVKAEVQFQNSEEVGNSREDFRNFVRVVAGTVPEGMSFYKWLQKRRISNSRYFEQGGEILVPTSFKNLTCGCCREGSDEEWQLKRNPGEVNILHTSCNKPVGELGSHDILV